MRYWGIHNGIKEDEARPERRKNYEYPHVPYDERMRVGDVACLFDINRCLYGWGTITAIAQTYQSTSGRPVRNITVAQSYLQYQIRQVNELRQLELFSDWERITDENLSWFSDQQAQYLRSLFPADNRPPDPAAAREERARTRLARPAETDFIQGRKLQYTSESRVSEFKTVTAADVVRTIVKELDEYVIAFLNLEDRRYEDYCRIFWGIDNSGIVVGVTLNEQAVDTLSTAINGKLRGVQPRIAASAYYVEVHNAKTEDGSLVADRVVVEVGVSNAEEDEFYCSENNSFYIRQDRNSTRLVGQALVAELRRRFRK